MTELRSARRSVTPLVARTVGRAGLAILMTLTGACNIIGTDRLTQMAQASLAQLQGQITLEGLQQDVEVLRDRWGVAHIYAATVEDLFFAQGYVAAQDRLWQLEIWRRVGEGRLAEIAGPVAFERDRLARLLQYRGDMDSEWTSYHPEAERIVTAFANGVNAFIEHNADNLPVEFKLTGVVPDPWSPEVPLLRMAGLPMTRNGIDEIELALAVSELGLEEANRRDNPEPWQRLRVPQGLDVGLVPREVRRVLQAGYAGIPRIPVLDEYEPLVDASVGDLASAGSNNWVVAGNMSVTGIPLLANDPHRRIMLPSLRYLVHLIGPDWNVIGAGEPALPGVAIGHNERIAWGLTIVGIDQQDIFVERVNPENRNQIRQGNRWEDLAVEIDTIWVKGEDPRVVELKFSRHGPILFEDTVNNRAYALKSVLAEPGTAGYLAALRVDQAGNWEEYLSAMDHWLVPSENMIYADVDGNIGWQAAGLTPVRCCGWIGRLPAPGDGRHEWRGFRPTSELPREFNPERGYIATANHNIMPDGYTPALGYNWSSPVRYHRIDDILSDSGGFTVDDFKRLQHDVYSSVAADAVSVLRDWVGISERTERARRFLAEWNAELHSDAPQAALFELWHSLVDRAALRSDTPAGQRDSLLESALASAVDSLERLQGQDWSRWTWGSMNRAMFQHRVTDAFDVPPVERSGDRTTVNVAAQNGASYREIIDLSDWDNSVATSVPGQSGQPESPHYDDLLGLWAGGEYFPLVFTREAVEAATEHRLVLRAPGR
jgi:penicillin amidase